MRSTRSDVVHQFLLLASRSSQRSPDRISSLLPLVAQEIGVPVFPRACRNNQYVLAHDFPLTSLEDRLRYFLSVTGPNHPASPFSEPSMIAKTVVGCVGFGSAMVGIGALLRRTGLAQDRGNREFLRRSGQYLNCSCGVYKVCMT